MHMAPNSNTQRLCKTVELKNTIFQKNREMALIEMALIAPRQFVGGMRWGRCSRVAY